MPTTQPRTPRPEAASGLPGFLHTWGAAGFKGEEVEEHEAGEGHGCGAWRACLSSGIWNVGVHGVRRCGELRGPRSQDRCVRTCAWLSACWAKVGPVHLLEVRVQEGGNPRLLGWDGASSRKSWRSEGDPASWPALFLHTGDRVPASHARSDSLPRSLALSAQGA